MKLSEIKGERALDVVADLVEPIANIAMDKDASEMFTKKPIPTGTDAREFTLKRMSASLPALIKNHKADLVKIFASINNIDYDECMETITIPSLVKGIVDIVTDDVFVQLFT